MAQWKKEVILRTGEAITLREMSPKDSPRELMIFINTLIEKKAMIMMDKEATLKEQNAWLKGRLSEIKKGTCLHILALHNNRIVGGVDAKRQPHKMRNNVEIGIAILPEFQSKGLGTTFMKEIIGLTKRKMRPKHIFLTVLGSNRHAQKLYRQFGFRKHHLLRKWVNHYGKYEDWMFMILKEKSNG